MICKKDKEERKGGAMTSSGMHDIRGNKNGS